MRKNILLIAALAFAMPLFALPIGRNAARQRAEQFAQTKGRRIVGEPRMAPGRKAAAERQPLYVFNMADDSGYVIVAGDDRAVNVLGYTLHGSYNADDIPINFRLWMEDMAQEIETVCQNPAAQAPLKVATHRKIEPLIKTHWGQGAATETGNIYNTLCPTIDGKYCFAGCVATAGAQIMYYYQHPKDSVRGVPGYEANELVDTSDPLPATRFKWEDMKLSYNSDDKGSNAAYAVAELMLYCGYAAKTKYGLTGSASNNWTMANGMAASFGYDPYTILLVSRSDFSISDWDAIIYHELEEGRPVLYGGGGTISGGHAFLCDGYDGEGRYHFNWGWNGSSDGYFTLAATNPYVGDVNKDGYIVKQSAVIGLQPCTGVVPEDVPLQDDRGDIEVIEGLTPFINNLRVNGTKIIMAGWNHNEEVCCFGFGIAAMDSCGALDFLEKRLYYQNNELAKNVGYGNMEYDLSKYGLARGQHTIVPVFSRKGEEEWYRCNPTYAYFCVDVGADTMTIEAHPIEKLRVDTFAVTSACVPYMRQKVMVKVTNEGDFYENNLAIYLGTEEDAGKRVTWVKAMISPGNTKEYEMWADLWNSEKGCSELAPGKYVLRLCPYNNPETVLATTTMVIDQKLEVTDIELTGNRLVQSVQEVVAKVKNSTGDYILPLYLFASQDSLPGPCVYRAGTALESGKVSDVVFRFAPQTEGDWNLWVATDTLATGIIGHETVNMKSLKYDGFEVTGCKMNKVKQSVDLTIVNPGGDYAATYYLFASTTEEKGSRKDLKEVAVAGGDTVVTTFFFTPTETGTWNLWLCSDNKGENVVAQTAVGIEEPPATRVKLEFVDGDVDYEGSTATITVTVKNVSETTSYRELYAWLIDDGERIANTSSMPMTIEPAGTGTAKLSFAALEQGKTYDVRLCYFPICTVNSVTLLKVFHLTLPAQSAEDLNNDGALTLADLAVLFSVMTGEVADGVLLRRADMNGDGRINMADVMVLLRALE